jgi:hypothetical protein
MALPFWSPVLDMLPDGGIYDPESGLSFNDTVPVNTQSTTQRTTEPLSTKTTVDTAEIDAQIAAAKEERNRIRTAANQKGLGPKAASTRKSNLNTAQKKLEDLQATKKLMLASNKPIVGDETDDGDTGGGGNGNGGGGGGGAGGGNVDTDAAYLEFLKEQKDLETAERQQTARATLEVLLRQFFFGTDASFVQDALNAAEGDIKLGLPTETIILKMQNYDDANSLFARRFTGNVKLRKEGIEPLSPAEYLEQESRYREVLSTRGLGELASRSTFGDLIGNQVSPFELEDRVTKVFDIYDNADAGLKSELQSTLKLDPLSTRTSVAKALLLGDKGSTELQRQVRTAEVGVEARTRGLDVTAAEELARMGVTREQARAGFEQISLTQPRLTQLSEIYTRETPDALGLQRELEREQFQGLQSQRRRRLAEQEQAAFMGQSGTAGSQSLGRRRTGSI